MSDINIDEHFHVKIIVHHFTQEPYFSKVDFEANISAALWQVKNFT